VVVSTREVQSVGSELESVGSSAPLSGASGVPEGFVGSGFSLGSAEESESAGSGVGPDSVMPSGIHSPGIHSPLPQPVVVTSVVIGIGLKRWIRVTDRAARPDDVGLVGQPFIAGDVDAALAELGAQPLFDGQIRILRVRRRCRVHCRLSHLQEPGAHLTFELRVHVELHSRPDVRDGVVVAELCLGLFARVAGVFMNLGQRRVVHPLPDRDRGLQGRAAMSSRS
jgi:hypothetical protein